MSNSNQITTITVIGCGYVGLTTAAILANCGLKVYALEVDKDRLETIKSGRSFFYEQGIDKLIAAGLANGNLMPTDDYNTAIPASSVIFSCVGTPDNADGSSNLSYVHDAAKRSAALVRENAIFTQKSTVPVGTGRQLQDIFAKAANAKSGNPAAASVRYVSNPEFLREGTAISDTLWFDRVIVGSDDAAAGQVADIYRMIERCRDDLAKLAGLRAPTNPPDARYITTTRQSAELIKVSANAFLALKISFANSIAKLADAAGADVIEVMDAVGADRRIGRAFLNAGRGYGGGCFPKDVSSLIRSAEDYGVDMEIMRAAQEVNDSMPHYVISRAAAALGLDDNRTSKGRTGVDGTFDGLKVAVLGVAFKAGTSDVRRSPGIVIANTLVSRGAQVSAYDPKAMAEADELAGAVSRCDDIATAVKGANVIFIATDWPEFKRLGSDKLAGLAGKQLRLIVDGMNCLDRPSSRSAVSYIGIGR